MGKVGESQRVDFLIGSLTIVLVYNLEIKKTEIRSGEGT